MIIKCSGILSSSHLAGFFSHTSSLGGEKKKEIKHLRRSFEIKKKFRDEEEKNLC